MLFYVLLGSYFGSVGIEKAARYLAAFKIRGIEIIFSTVYSCLLMICL